MFARALLVGFLALIPALAFGDTSNPTNSSLTPQGNGALLGPASSADSSTLQGASQSPLQSTPNSSTGLTAPNGDPLQAGNTPDDLKVIISSDADGSPVDVVNNTTAADLPSMLVAGAILLAMIALVLYSRNRERRT